MFTGIVDHVGKLAGVEHLDGVCRLMVDSRFDRLEIGESIAVDGACLTVIDPSQGKFICELSAETLARTTAAKYEAGTAVNLERSLRVGDRLGGHWVCGHVDSRGRVRRRVDEKEFIRFEIEGVEADFSSYLIPKGSIAVNGVSLTLNEISPGGFAVTVIPHTAERTNLGALRQGDPVNLEFDWMTKVIVSEVRKRLTHG